MASLDKQEKESKTNPDADLVSMMGFRLLDNGGLETIKTALDKSQDPAQVVGQFLAQMIGQMAEYTQTELGVDPAVYTEPNGFLDQQLDYIERKLSLPKEFSDQVYGDTLEVIKAAAAQPPQQGQPMQGQPAPGPQQAPPQGGLDRGVM